VLGILALLFAPAKWAEADHDDRTLGAAVLAPSFSSAELPRVENLRADDPLPDARGRSAPQPVSFLLIGFVAVTAVLVQRRPALVDRDSVLAAPWRWRGPPLPSRLT
jgi:hypothetical protein